MAAERETVVPSACTSLRRAPTLLNRLRQQHAASPPERSESGEIGAKAARQSTALTALASGGARDGLRRRRNANDGGPHARLDPEGRNPHHG